MNLSTFRRLSEKRVIALICLVIFGIMVVAAFWPFDFHPANHVTWLGNENGLRFGGTGIVLSSGKLAVLDSPAPSGASLEIWLEPAQVKNSTALLAISSSANPEQFRLRQARDQLLVLEEPFVSRNRSALTAMWVAHAFQAHKRRFITISSGAQGTTVYLDGVPVEKSTTFRFTPKDLSGQLIIGGSPIANDTWHGRLLGLAIFGREVSATQVSEDYQAWLNGRPEILKNDQPAALYVFGERTGNIVQNQIPSAPGLVIPQSFRIPYKPFLKAFWKEFSFDRSYLRDVLINIAGFVPFGFFFCMYFASDRTHRKAAVLTVILGALFSVTIEILQGYIPVRDSGTTDIFTNTLGTAIGAMLYRAGTLQALLDKLESGTNS